MYKRVEVRAIFYDFWRIFWHIFDAFFDQKNASKIFKIFSRQNHNSIFPKIIQKMRQKMRQTNFQAIRTAKFLINMCIWNSSQKPWNLWSWNENSLTFSGSLSPSKMQNKTTKKPWKPSVFKAFFGRGSRTWTHDQRFWSGSKRKKALQNLQISSLVWDLRASRFCVLMLYWCSCPLPHSLYKSRFFDDIEKFKGAVLS